MSHPTDTQTNPSRTLAPPAARAWGRSPLLAAATLILVLVAAGWLRRAYLLQVAPHVDEFTTLWAAEQAQEYGAPWMPSGVLYTRGLLHTWLTAGALTLAGARAAAESTGTLAPLYAAGRWPSVWIGLATILLLYGVGARGWSRGVGLLAALGLALLPEAIVWSGRARFYALLALLVLLLLWLSWEWTRRAPPALDAPGATGRRSGEWAFALGWALLFALALFTQEQTLLLLPGILLCMLLWRGWRWMVGAPRLVAFALAAAATAARYVVEIQGQPGYFETIQASRPYLGLGFDLVGAWRVYGPLFTAPLRLLWTAGALVAVAATLVAWLRRSALRALPPPLQSTLFYAINFALPLGAILLLVGTSWRDVRYLFFVQPLWLLLGAAGLVQLIEWATRAVRAPERRAAWQLAAGAALAAVLLLTMAGPARQATRAQEVGYAPVLEQVATQRQPGDAILSPQPPACALVLGPCTGFAIERGYEEYVIRSGARGGIGDGWVDRWSGAPLVNSTAALSATVAAAPHTWFVSDGFRLATRFDAPTLRFLLTHFDPIVEEQGVVALRSDGLRYAPDLNVNMPLSGTPSFGPLQLVQARRADNFGPELPLLVDLEWVASSPISTQINTSVRLVNQAGEIVAQSDGPPARGIIPTTLFFDTPLPDTKAIPLPVALPNERYRIDVAAYTVGPPGADGAPTITPLGEPLALDWFLYASNHAPLTPPRGAWQNGISLLGAWPEVSGSAPGAPFEVTLIWAAGGPTPTPLTAFVQLLDGAGAVVAQHDKQPDDGFFPTTGWREQTGPVYNSFTLLLPERMAPDRYRLVTGWYDETGARVPVEGGGDVIELAVFDVQ